MKERERRQKAFIKQNEIEKQLGIAMKDDATEQQSTSHSGIKALAVWNRVRDRGTKE